MPLPIWSKKVNVAEPYATFLHYPPPNQSFWASPIMCDRDSVTLLPLSACILRLKMPNLWGKDCLWICNWKVRILVGYHKRWIKHVKCKLSSCCKKKISLENSWRILVRKMSKNVFNCFFSTTYGDFHNVYSSLKQSKFY